jgi:hypothetical protein
VACGTEVTIPPRCDRRATDARLAPHPAAIGAEYATTVSTATVGSAVIEVRPSEVCGAGWARITRAVPGDEVRIAVGGKARQSALVNDDDVHADGGRTGPGRREGVHHAQDRGGWLHFRAVTRPRDTPG